MAGSRTLKLSILADVDNLKKQLDVGSKEVEGFGSKLGNFSKIAGAAFAAAGVAAAAYAGKLAIDGVKAAIEDEAAQVKLATSLKNVTGATNAQIAATEAYILQTSLAFGVTDDQLRPSLDRLVRSTFDAEEAQRLQTLALNIAAGTGKDLQAVSEALAKAHDGNFTALKKLGGGIDENILKTKNFDEATAALSKTFEGQASKQAETFQGKLDRLKIAFDEGKETVGSFILDAITPLVSGIVNNVVPAIQAFASQLGGADGLKNIFVDIIATVRKFFIPIVEGLKFAFDQVRNAIESNKESFVTFFEFAKTFILPFLSGALKIAIQGIGLALSAVVTLVARLIDGFEAVIELGAKVAGVFKNINPFGGGRASGGPVRSGTTYLVGEQGPELFSPSSNGFITPNKSLAASGGSNTTININVSGAIDPISTARQISDILSTAATSTGSFINIGQSRLVGA
jgi:hypothetical protein